MLIVGARGFAKEVLEVVLQLKSTGSIFFYDDVSDDTNNYLYDKFKCLKNINELNDYVENKSISEFTLGVGNPIVREKLYKKFMALGLEPISLLSPSSHIGSFDVSVGKGVNIMTGVVITNSISIGNGCLINLNCTIGHDSVLREFVELSPGVHISGNCLIERFVTIGTNATILPKLRIGENSIIGAGSVVTSDIPPNSVAVGVPAKVIKQI